MTSATVAGVVISDEILGRASPWRERFAVDGPVLGGPTVDDLEPRELPRED